MAAAAAVVEFLHAAGALGSFSPNSLGPHVREERRLLAFPTRWHMALVSAAVPVSGISPELPFHSQGFQSWCLVLLSVSVQPGLKN